MPRKKIPDISGLLATCKRGQQEYVHGEIAKAYSSFTQCVQESTKHLEALKNTPKRDSLITKNKISKRVSPLKTEVATKQNCKYILSCGLYHLGKMFVKGEHVPFDKLLGMMYLKRCTGISQSGTEGMFARRASILYKDCGGDSRLVLTNVSVFPQQNNDKEEPNFSPRKSHVSKKILTFTQSVQASNLIIKHKYDKAITAFSRILLHNPKCGYSYYRLFLLYYIQGKYNKAMTNLKGAVRLNYGPAMNTYVGKHIIDNNYGPKVISYLEMAVNEGSKDAMLNLATYYLHSHESNTNELIQAWEWIRNHSPASRRSQLVEMFILCVIDRPRELCFDIAKYLYGIASYSMANELFVFLKSSKAPKRPDKIEEDATYFIACINVSNYIEDADVLYGINLLQTLRDCGHKEAPMMLKTVRRKHPKFFSSNKLVRNLSKSEMGSTNIINQTQHMDNRLNVVDPRSSRQLSSSNTYPTTSNFINPMEVERANQAYWDEDYATAYPVIKKLVQQGHFESYFKLAYLLDNGEGCERNRKLALHYYQLSAQYTKSKCAMHNIGVIYENEPTLKNLPLARIWYQKSASLGFAKSIFNLAVMYKTGVGGEKNVEEAIHLYKKAIDLNHEGAMNNLAVMYQNGKYLSQNYDKAREYYEKAAELGNRYAMKNLGVLYQDGLSVTKDLQRAFKLYKMSADREYDVGMKRLADMYEKGLGVQQNMIKAMHWWKSAADLGNTDALFKLGFCYQTANSVEKNYKIAADYYERCIALSNFKPAKHNLAIIYCNGQRGVLRKNQQRAKELYLSAINDGYTISCNNLARMYRRGQGCKQSYEKALYYYRLGSDNNHDDATNGLATMYEMGQGVLQNQEMAVSLYRKAADNNYSWAQNNLALCYEHGLGVARCEITALKLYQRAASSGHEMARNRFKDLQETIVRRTALGNL